MDTMPHEPHHPDEAPHTPTSAPLTEWALPSGGALFKEAWRRYGERLWVLVGIEAIPYVAFIAALALFSGGGLLAIFGGQKAGIDLGTITAGGIVAGTILILGAVYFFTWTSVAIVRAVAEPEHPDILRAYRQSHNMVFSYLWVSMLAGLAIFGGILLLVVPGMLLALRYSQISFTVALEERRGRDALRQSTIYVKGRMSAVAWRLFYLLGVTVLAHIGISILGSALRHTIGGNPETVLTNLFTIAWSPLIICYSWVLYKHLKHSSAEHHSANPSP
ncbi:MAG: hypothetical protein Q8Q39_00710 [bacterium]|nr:hypothetical protein [bacterium]